jgi:hypothetical protein
MFSLVHLEPRLAGRIAVVAALTAVAGVTTVATRSGWISVSHLAASPNAIGQGKVWLLLTSGVVADRPWLPSLLGFAIVAVAVLSAAHLRVVVLAALAGQVLATLAVYGCLGLARAVHPGAFDALENTPDIGLSAIIAAWIGVVAEALWGRHCSRRAHMLIVLGCIGCALIGLAFHTNLTALDTEHIVAFAFGVGTAAWWPRLELLSASLPRWPLARPRWPAPRLQPLAPSRSVHPRQPSRP